MAKVSAIVSAYYAEPYIEGRILNLQQQTLRPQIIVVAQEKSIEARIAEGILNGEDVLVDTPDVPSIYTAWNLGIEAARGEYITNANSDDRLAGYAIEFLASALDRNPTHAVAYADVDIVEALTGGVDYAWRIGYFKWAEGGLDELMKHCFLGPQPMWRKSLHDKYGPFDASFQSAGDYEFWLRLAAHNETFHHLRTALGIYLKRPDQAEARFNADGTAGKEIEIARQRYS